MVNNLFIFIVAMWMVIKGATLSAKYTAKFAKNLNLSKYTIGFIIIAGISILPETFISISSSLEGIPSFGLGTLFGSNIADLTLVFAIIILLAKRGMKVESKILKIHKVYPFFLLLPIFLGLDGFFSRAEGITLIIAGSVFYYVALKNGVDTTLAQTKNGDEKYKNIALLLASLIMMLIGSHFTVTSASSIAYYLGINPVLIGMLVVGLGTTMPELFFSLKSVTKEDDELAIGDILGTVLADATIVVGILAIVNPFSFPQKIIYVTGMFMVVASFVLFYFMKTGRNISKRESYALFAFWLMFVLVEFLVNH